ncbi:dihydrofolate reductase [Pedobacter sp. SYSU D00535]|uniref:dihydrofolate reductase n=1 Tax=Pedobacter sp. SYSU D00535 TaxID=2810308 RepID=UPI001A96C332|nr:dihydrofolate reductase [Pedobacter sp. SYSU D00535]
MTSIKQNGSPVISNVVVVDEQWGIGKNNQLLVHFPADLKRFKSITTGHTIIMGRKTFDSMGRALPNRRNVVVSRQKDLKLEGAEVFDSLDEALKACQGEAEVFIIGGAEIFRQAIEITDRVYLTRIHETFDADTFFPKLATTEWVETEVEEHEPDEKNPFHYSYITYQRA